MPRFIFRMTHYRNVEQHMADGMLYARNNPNGEPQFSICYDQIVQRRGTQIFTPNQQNINQYVPFYFSPCTGMALAIDRGGVDFRAPDGSFLQKSNSEDIVFYVCDPNRVRINNLEYWITNIGCNSGIRPEFSNDIGDLENHVNWKLFDERPRMGSIREIGYDGVCKYTFNRDNPPEHQNRMQERMAEFLVRDNFPIELVECIITKSDNKRTQVEHWASEFGRNINVFTKRGCFF